MAPRKETTNRELLEQLEASNREWQSELKQTNRELRDSIGAVGKIVMEVQRRVAKLDKWMDEVKAVEAYIEKHPVKPESQLNKQLLKALLVALGIITTLVGAITAGLKL